MKKSLILLATSALILGACASSPATTSGDTDTVSTSETMFTTSISGISRNITTGGALLDVDFDNFAVGNTYQFTFTISDDTGKPTVTMSNEAIATVKQESTGYSFTVKKAGDVILTIKDSTDYTCYKKVLHCRDKIAKDDVVQYLINVDHWQSWPYFTAGEQTTEKIVFLDFEHATLTGTDAGTNIGTCTFDFAFKSETDDEFFFTVSNFVNNVNSFKPQQFNVDKTGRNLHLMISDGQGGLYTATIFSPASAA